MSPVHAQTQVAAAVPPVHCLCHDAVLQVLLSCPCGVFVQRDAAAPSPGCVIGKACLRSLVALAASGNCGPEEMNE